MYYIKHERQCHQEESLKYDTQRSVFDELRGV